MKVTNEVVILNISHRGGDRNDTILLIQYDNIMIAVNMIMLDLSSIDIGLILSRIVLRFVRCGFKKDDMTCT